MEYALWIGLMVVFIVIEMSTASLVCIWFAFGALAAAVSKIFGISFFAQLVIFVAASA